MRPHAGPHADRQLAAPHAAEASTYRWQVDANGDWNNPANWAVVEGPAGAGYPNLPGDVAVFGEPLTDVRTITIPDLVTVSIGRLESTSSVVIDRLGSGLLVFDNAGETATIEGGVMFLTPFQLNADLTVTGSFEVHGISETGGPRSLTLAAGGLTMERRDEHVYGDYDHREWIPEHPRRLRSGYSHPRTACRR